MKGREISVKSQFEIREGDFVISKRQIVHGACAIVPAEFSGSVVSNEYAVLRCRPTLDPEYLRWLVHSLHIQQTFFHSSIGVHVEKMIFRLEEWFRWQVDLPPVDEQRRRASNMNALHTRLEGLRRERTLLADYKTGLMQRIFSQDLRFRADDGSAFPIWEKRRLGQVIEVNYGKDHKVLSDGDISVFGTGGVIRHVNKALSNGPAIMIGRKGTIDRPFYVEGPFWIVDTLFYAKAKYDFDTRFVFALVQMVRWMRFNEATGVPSLSSSAINAVPVVLPPHPDEQRKIADALGAIDAKIGAVAAQIDRLETFKRGMLQKMFV